MRFSTEMKSHTDLSSFRLLCERTLSRYVQLKPSFSDEKTSAVKSETHLSRKAIENERGKVLKENAIIGRSWNPAKLSIVQN